MKILKLNEYKNPITLNESVSTKFQTSFIKKLVHRIVSSKTNNETFDYYGHSVNIQSGTKDYADITIDNSVSFSIDYYTLELHFENVDDLDTYAIYDIIWAFHNELDDSTRKVSVSFARALNKYSNAEYTLTRKDITTLKKWGYEDDDINQIQRCLYEHGFIMTDQFDKEVNAETAIKMVGKENFLSGLGRSCFHWSAYRSKGKNSVDFDTSDWHNR